MTSIGLAGTEGILTQLINIELQLRTLANINMLTSSAIVALIKTLTEETTPALLNTNNY